MPSTYSPNLRIELIATGEQAGTWGTTTNTNLGTLIEDAIAGYVSVSITSANQALTANNGTADQSRNMTINLTTTTSAPFNVYIPPADKVYIIRNSSSYDATIYCSTVLGNTTAAGTGVTIPAGNETLVFSDGTNVAFGIDCLNSLKLTSGTANGVVYLNASKAATSGSAFVFDGSLLRLTGLASICDANAYLLFRNAANTTSNGVVQFPDTGAASIQQYRNEPLYFATNNVERGRFSAAGGFSVGTTSDPGAGAIYATGNITAYFSDDRLKTKLGKIENALDKLCSLDGFYYEANETAQALGYEAKREVGVSAQKMQEILPEIVAPAPVDNNYLTIRYERALPLIVEAIKELRAEIDALKKGN